MKIRRKKMFRLRGSRRRKTEEIIKKFLKSYAENEKNQDKKDLKSWLILELQNELPNKKAEDIEKIATELISGIEIYYTKKKEVEKYQSLGITNGHYVGNEILEKVADEIEEAEIVDTKEIIEDMKEASNILSNYNEATIYETAAIKEPQLIANVFQGTFRQFSNNNHLKEEGKQQINKVSESVSGPVGIIGQLFPAFTSAGPTNLAFLAAVISISLACMNVLPIPALDGGRWLLIGTYKLRKKKLKKETEEKIVGRAFLALIALSILITILDILKFTK